MLIIGLTGGIGSGKSTVAEFFSRLDVPIIDSDIIAKQVMTANDAILEKIVQHFGVAILDENRKLDRAKLRQCIFEDMTQRQWLEKLLHPIIIAEIKQRIATLNVPYCIVVIPLLAEVPETQALVDRILLVDVSEELQIARVMQRDHLTQQAAQRILASQASRAQRLNIANDIIENAADIKALQKKVLQLHQLYTDYAKSKDS